MSGRGSEISEDNTAIKTESVLVESIDIQRSKKYSSVTLPRVQIGESVTVTSE